MRKSQRQPKQVLQQWSSCLLASRILLLRSPLLSFRTNNKLLWSQKINQKINLKINLKINQNNWQISRLLTSSRLSRNR